MRRNNADLGALRRLTRTAKSGQTYVPGCSGKTRYATGKKANEALLELKAKGTRKATIYQCKNPECRGWHVTSHPKKEKR